MSSSKSRKATAALLIFAFISLAAPTASQARIFGRSSFEGPAREIRERGFFSYLRLLFDFTGGAMDPNGHS